MMNDWIEQNKEMLEKLRKAMELLEGFGEIVIKYQNDKLVDLRAHPCIKVK